MTDTNTADIAQATYTYEWTSVEQTFLRRTDAEGKVAFVPADPVNRDYAEFLSSGATAADYIAPPPPPELTAEEKVTRLLSDYGLSRDELRKTLDIAS
jgi:hypothetical protein